MILNPVRTARALVLAVVVLVLAGCGVPDCASREVTDALNRMVLRANIKSVTENPVTALINRLNFGGNVHAFARNLHQIGFDPVTDQRACVATLEWRMSDEREPIDEESVGYVIEEDADGDHVLRIVPVAYLDAIYDGAPSVADLYKWGDPVGRDTIIAHANVALDQWEKVRLANCAVCKRVAAKPASLKDDAPPRRIKPSSICSRQGDAPRFACDVVMYFQDPALTKLSSLNPIFNSGVALKQRFIFVQNDGQWSIEGDAVAAIEHAVEERHTVR